MHAETIDDVLDTLSAIVADAKARRDPLGYFAALYRQVTLTVKAGIEGGRFEDGPRMSRFDALFANEYFTALDQYRHGRRASRAWQFAFNSSRSGRLLILQDLLLAINAHINLDLGVVAGSTFPGPKLVAFHDDFDEINNSLASLIPQARNAIKRFSPRLAELDEVGGPDVALALNFSVDAARDNAWRSALVVSVLPADVRPLAVVTLDGSAKLLGRIVAAPPEPVASVVRFIREAERHDVRAIIVALDSLV